MEREKIVNQKKLDIVNQKKLESYFLVAEVLPALPFLSKHQHDTWQVHFTVMHSTVRRCTKKKPSRHKKKKLPSVDYCRI